VESIIACCPSSVVGAILVAAAIALGGPVAVAFDDVDFGGDDLDGAEQRLRQLEDLRRKGLISRAEYEQRRQMIVEGLYS
jgi:hypothetical protein